MKTDLYTKIILSVIAVCLTINLVKDFDIIPKAYAGEKNKSELNLPINKNYGLVPINADGTINVNIKNSETLKVHIQEVDRFAFRFCTVPVEIQN